jgi:peptidoglycan-N-acetylglucosamine deacetylase
LRSALVLLACLTLLLGACRAPGSDQAGEPPGSAAPSLSGQPVSPSPMPSAVASSPAPPPAVPPSPSRTTAAPGVAQPSPSTTRPTRIGPAGSYMVTGTDNVALTFDDGPYPESTPQILDLLRSNGIKATFCVLGRNAHTYPQLIRRIYDEGHTLCNHSWRHDMELRTRDEGAIRDDLAATLNAIREAAPSALVPYFRAPGGYFDAKLIGVARSMGMTSLYWHVDTRDWDTRSFGRGKTMVDQIIANVKRNTRPGSIILSHDNLKPDTVTAYKTLMPWLKARFTLTGMPSDGQLARS